MKILIIGGTSSLGLALKEQFSKRNEVITAGRKNCDIIFDLNDAINNIVFPENIDVVIHTAAHFGGKTASEMLEAESVNVLGTLKMCQAAAKVNTKHFILISSIFALLDSHSKHYSAYTLTKKQSEEIAGLFCSSVSLPLAIIRPSQLYGNIPNFNLRQPFLNSILEKAERGEDVNIFGSLDAKINVIHLEDVVKIIERVAQQKIVGTFTCQNPQNISYKQFAKTAYKVFEKNGKINFLTDKENIEDNIFKEDNLLYEKINFYPKITLEAGLKGIVNYRKN